MTAAQSNPGTTSDASVLVVDPSSMSRSAITKLLARHHTVFTADNGETAWSMLKERRPDAIVIDLTHDEDDGFALLGLIRKASAPELNGMTALAVGPNDRITRAALEAGATAYLAKPYDSKALLGLLRNPPPAPAANQAGISAPSAFDKLTGLPNKDYFEYRGHKELAFAKRYNKNLAIVVLQIDDLNGIVESYGAPLAKQIIKKLAGYIADAVRTEDTVARLTGRSFGIVAPSCDEFGAKSVADRVIDRVRRRTFQYGAQRVRFTISAGLGAPRLVNCNDFTDLAGLAMERLHSAVAAGGNRAVFDGESFARARTQATESVALEQMIEQADDTGVHSRVNPAVTGTAAALRGDGRERREHTAAVPDNASEEPVSLDVMLWLLENGLEDELKPHYGTLLEQLMPLLNSAGDSMGDDMRTIVDALRKKLEQQ